MNEVTNKLAPFYAFNLACIYAVITHSTLAFGYSDIFGHIAASRRIVFNGNWLENVPFMDKEAV